MRSNFDRSDLNGTVGFVDYPGGINQHTNDRSDLRLTPEALHILVKKECGNVERPNPTVELQSGDTRRDPPHGLGSAQNHVRPTVVGPQLPRQPRQVRRHVDRLRASESLTGETRQLAFGAIGPTGNLVGILVIVGHGVFPPINCYHLFTEALDSQLYL